MATNPQRVRRSLEAEICRDLAVPTRSTAAVMLRSSLGLAEVDRYGAINSGRVGRNQLIAVLAWARRVLDANLDAPAAWRGPGRNAHAAGRREKPLWLRHAFTEVTAAITDISAEGPVALEPGCRSIGRMENTRDARRWLRRSVLPRPIRRVGPPSLGSCEPRG